MEHVGHPKFRRSRGRLKATSPAHVELQESLESYTGRFVIAVRNFHTPNGARLLVKETDR